MIQTCTDISQLFGAQRIISALRLSCSCWQFHRPFNGRLRSRGYVWSYTVDSTVDLLSLRMAVSVNCSRVLICFVLCDIYRWKCGLLQFVCEIKRGLSPNHFRLLFEPRWFIPIEAVWCVGNPPCNCRDIAKRTGGYKDTGSRQCGLDNTDILQALYWLCTEQPHIFELCNPVVLHIVSALFVNWWVIISYCGHSQLVWRCYSLSVELSLHSFLILTVFFW